MEAASDQGPYHLARTVLRALSVSVPEPPDLAVLEVFFDAVYQVSFRAQGGCIVWQDLERQDRETPFAVSFAASEPLVLTPPVPLGSGSLVSLLAAASEQAALLVSGSGSQLTIQGIARREQSLPGLFSVDILGPAHLKVYAGLDCPIELRRNRLHLSAPQVFKRGPVRERVSALLHGLFPAIQAQLPAEAAASPLLSAGALPLPDGHILRHEQDWPGALEQFWMDALADLLRRVSENHSGGIVALTSQRREAAPLEDKEPEEWLLPRGAVFAQARQSLERRAVRAITQQSEAVQALSERLAVHGEIAPDEPALQEPLLWLGAPGSDLGTASALQFLASLSQGDGILCLEPKLDLISFGGEPGGRLPERVYLAGDEAASEAHLIPISSRSFGPRNQALLRLCQQDPSAVGFAVTQEKELRAMLRRDDKLIIWNSAALPRTV